MSVFVIAEAGSNFNGSFHLAKEMILEADLMGADAVKFQAIPPMRNSWARRLKEIADDVDVELMVTPFDFKGVEEWGPYVKRWKIASAELVNLDLVGYAAGGGEKPMILSSGMASPLDVERALEVCWRWWNGHHADVPTVLQCVGSYPAPYADVNLRCMGRLSRALQYRPGLSDHTLGTHIPIAAVALGAEVIEKHFTLAEDGFHRANAPVDYSGPDHHYALKPDEFAYMVRCIRDVEKAMGDGIKRPMPGEAIEARGRQLTSI